MARPVRGFAVVMRGETRQGAGMKWSRLGLGTGQLGAAELSEAAAAELVVAALAAGVTVFDTACGYGESEARLGRSLRGRRPEAVLVTKVGYGVAGVADWSYDCVARGVDAALQRLATDYLDVVLLHSCDAEILARGECTQALLDAKAAGKLRAVGYSGDGAPLTYALHAGCFEVLECSVSVCDQRVYDEVLPLAAARGIAVLAKRALANAPWRYADCPRGSYVEEYWWRWTTMAPQASGLLAGLEPAEVALRFAAFAPAVRTALVGTTCLAHLQAALQAMARGPLPVEQVRAWRQRFSACDPGWWVGQV